MSDLLRVLAVLALVAGDVRLRVEQLDGNRITRLLVQLPADSGARPAS